MSSTWSSAIVKDVYSGFTGVVENIFMVIGIIVAVAVLSLVIGPAIQLTGLATSMASATGTSLSSLTGTKT